MTDQVSIFWFRRDLRIDDNAGLYHALKAGIPVLPVFIFDTNILDDLQDKADKRIQFIHDALHNLQATLVKHHSTLRVMYGTPMECYKQLAEQYRIAAVYTNHDYEPYARERDRQMAAFLMTHNISFHTFKDQVIFERNEVLKDNNEPYTVFTPYSRKWKERLNDFYLSSYPTQEYLRHLYHTGAQAIPALADIGFLPAPHGAVPAVLDEHIARDYDKTRDFPAIHGTTHLSVHLRFGTISIRRLATQVRALNATLLNELIWREFYQMILWHFPHVMANSFKKEYDHIQWRNNEHEFDAWCSGNTGFPIVDAGMRELNETGFMHNRVRMIVASFLTKDLLIDWRWGEAYFGKKLLDYDLAANNGGWQWAAGSGCDAAPYFRVFNPTLQTQKFDARLQYVRKWVPEFESLAYTSSAIVAHNVARDRCLRVYKAALNAQK